MYNNDMRQKLTLRYILILISCCGLSAAALGMLTNVAGVFFTPVADDLGVGRGLVSLTYTISCLALAAGGLLTVRITSRLPLRVVVISAGLLFALSTAGCGLAKGILVLYILNAVRGLAAGVIGNVLVTQIMNSWFLKNTGTFTSIAMALSGLTGAVFSLVLSKIIAAADWRAGYYTAAAISLLFELPAMLFLRSIKPQDAGYAPYGSGSDDHTSVSGSGAPAVRPSETTETVLPPADPVYADAVSSKTLLKAFLLTLFFAMSAALATSYPQHFPGISESLIHSPETGALMVTICLIMNSVGKLTLGVLTDRFGTRRSVLLFSSLLFSGFLLLLFVRKPAGMFPAAALIGLSYALSTVGIVMMVRTVFGLERYNQIYPRIVLFATVSSAFGSSLIGFIYDGTGSYIPAFILVIAVIALEIAAVFTVFKMKK